MVKFDGEEDDKNAVLKFAGAPPLRLGPPTVVGTLGGVSGAPPPGLLWTPTIELHTREETIRQYQQLRPTTVEKVRNWLLNKQPDPRGLESLRTWLLKTSKEAGYRSLTIACFTPLDPTVFIYGDRPPERRGEIVFQVFWDDEREEWVDAAMLEREQGAEIFEDLKATVLATACDTISF